MGKGWFGVLKHRLLIEKYVKLVKETNETEEELVQKLRQIIRRLIESFNKSNIFNYNITDFKVDIFSPPRHFKTMIPTIYVCITRIDFKEKVKSKKTEYNPWKQEKELTEFLYEKLGLNRKHMEIIVSPMVERKTGRKLKEQWQKLKEQWQEIKKEETS